MQLFVICSGAGNRIHSASSQQSTETIADDLDMLDKVSGFVCHVPHLLLPLFLEVSLCTAVEQQLRYINVS